MRRREVSELALRLYSQIEELAKGYNRREHDLEHAKTLKRWQVVALVLAEFLQEMHDRQDASERSMEGMWLAQGLSHFLESIRKGRPTLADHVSRIPGQKVGMDAEHDLVRCCFAVTCLMNAGDSKEQAVRQVAAKMKEAGVALPPRRGSKKRSIPDWQSLNNWRDKLITAERGIYLYKQYNAQLNKISFETPAEWRNYADAILRLLGYEGGNP